MSKNKKSKTKHTKAKIVFVLIVLILIFIISTPSFKKDKKEHFDIYTFEEFVQTYSNSTYTSEEDVFKVIEKIYGKPKKDNSFFRVFEDEACKPDCHGKKIIVNKKDKTVMVRKDKDEEEK